MLAIGFMVRTGKVRFDDVWASVLSKTPNFRNAPVIVKYISVSDKLHYNYA